ncbi:SET domain-containing protein-lysine N-methyltransferase [Pseudomonas salmasensis]|uniref:SET domain-containing protein-lysine N-methyltransferase n=1 Tax=Pseudomonas salmasensis TaxID=2745514 RepID=UPI001646EBD5|nr:SET domain-containing protein-lysine N-methyltransferase [Pseudomonas salmasensis]QXH79195.1 SET domain-containing protein [Pseudomonas salmasensis]
MTNVIAARTHFSLPLPAAEHRPAPVTDDTLLPQRPNQDLPLSSNPVLSLGALGGALSWPIPLSADEQRRLRLITLNHAHHLGDQPLVMQTDGGVLEFLRYRQPLPAEAGNDPAKILEALVNSPQGQRMGKVLQQTMQGIDSESSASDYLLAAIVLQMDPESITTPDRTSVADFDLGSDTHAGLHACTVVAGLAEHLSRTGKTSAALASVGAYLLLAKAAPQFLIKDIPATVKVGSQAWASLTIAAMAIEAQTPGKVPGMTFAQVMSDAQEARRIAPAVTQAVETRALLDWAVASGELTKRPDGDYLPAQLESARAAFNAQLDTRLAASQALDNPLPTRKEIALARLKERFGDLGAFFEEKVFAVDQHYVVIEGGRFSLLDIAMIDWLEYRPFKAHEPSSSLKGKDLQRVLKALNANRHFGVPAEFDRQFSRAIKEKKAAVNTTVRHMISQLPLEDRQRLEFGKISFFQEGSYVMDGHFNNTYGPNKPGLLVKTELQGASHAYVIDFNKGTIERASLYDAKIKEHRNGNRVSTTKAFSPSHKADDLGRERPLSHSPCNSFTSARSEAIGMAFVEHLDLDAPAIKQQARGQTALDTANAQLSEFLLNLIPFRSAIVNFQSGQYGAGAFDLLLDVFGFLTTGAATAGKLLKVGRSALSTGAKALRAAKVVGVAAIEVLNPVGGVGDLPRLVASGALYVLSKGVKAVNKLRGATGSYDVLKSISKQYEAAATGTVKVAGQTVEGAAVLKGGKWYAFDADTMRPYGSPLEEFKASTQAVAGEVDTAHLDQLSELNHELFGHFKVPESEIAGLTRNSQGVYVATDGHVSHIRHTDSNGETAVYEVRQVTRTEEGGVQARIYHNNRQTELLVQHVQGDEWQRLGAPGGGQVTAEHLRAWEALSPAQQTSLTRKGFAKKNNLPQKTFEFFVKTDGQLSDSGVLVRNRPANTFSEKVTGTHVRDWQNMTQAQRDEMTQDGFAVLHNLRPGTFKTYARKDGTLMSRGETLINSSVPTKSNQITDDHLRQWDELFRQPGNALTSAQFVSQHGLSQRSWAQYVKADGSLKEAGTQRLERARQNAALVSGVQPRPCIAEHLRDWQALSFEQQQSLSRAGFARQKHIHPRVFERYVQPDGQLTVIGVAVRDRAPNTPFYGVTETHIRDWQDMPQAERDALTLEGFAEMYHVNPGSFKTHVRRDGSLGRVGRELMDRVAGVVPGKITDDHLRQWKALADDPDNVVTQAQFTRENGLHPGTWRDWVNVDGSLKKNATNRLERAALGPMVHAPRAVMEVITAQHLREWEALPRARQQSVTRKGFARQKHISPRTFDYYVQPDGKLSPTGVLVRDRAANTPAERVTELHIQAWQNMTPQARETMTMEGFAGQHNLSVHGLRANVRTDGSLSAAGEALLKSAADGSYRRITTDLLRQWQLLAGDADNAVTQAQFLQQHRLSPDLWKKYVKADGSFTAMASQRLERLQQSTGSHMTPEILAADTPRKRPASEPLDSPQPKVADLTPRAQTPQSVEAAGSSSAIPPVVIKVEPSDFPTLPPHQIDNTLPILQDPTNPRLSLTQSLEGPIDDIRIAYWNGVLDGLDSPTKARVSAQIKASIKDWLRTEGQHQSRFDEVLEVVTPLDDGGPARGASVWARRDIPQFEVLGPYAGKFHASEASLFEEQRKQGSRAVLTYLFGTRSLERTVSGLHTGNTLSLINTSQLGTGPAWKSNNVVSISVGKNLTFYVALKDIKKGEELLLDYGPFYKPVPDIAIKPDPDR